MFPTNEDIRAHRRARTLQKKENIELSRRADEVSDPQELVNFILEIATKKYRRGDRKMEFSIDVPTDNFIPWANAAKIGSKDWDSLDRRLMKQEVARLARIALKRGLAPGVYLRLTSSCIAGTRLSFTVTMSVIKPS